MQKACVTLKSHDLRKTHRLPLYLCRQGRHLSEECVGTLSEDRQRGALTVPNTADRGVMALQNRRESEEEISYDFQDLRRRFTHLEEGGQDSQHIRHMAPLQERRYDFQQSRRVAPEERAHNFQEVRSRFMNGGEESKDIRRGTAEEKCYDPLDTTLTFVKGDDVLDFLCNDFKSLRAKMSCGHAVTPMSLTLWCLYLLEEGECRFVCGQTGCNVEWPYEEVCKMALLTPEEMDYFEKKMFSNAAKNYLDVKFCPGCKCRVVRTDLHNLSVCCTVCTAEKKRVYLFCWQCLREVKFPALRFDHCENDGCFSQPLETLRRCPDITFESVRGVTGCPSIRACPTCGFLVGHNKKQCKTMVCPRCKVKFCFVCLQFSDECLKRKPYDLCSSGVAPRQASIPVWKRT